MTTQMTLKLIFVIILMVLQTQQTLIYFPGLQVNPMLIFKVQAACDRLESDLRATFGTSLQNDQILLGKIYLADYYLKALSADPAIAQYNNIIVG